MTSRHAGSERLVQVGLLVNAVLAAIKLVAGVAGNSYALIADAAESGFDILGSLVVWGGVRIASRAEDETYPFGYGKAEPLAAAVVALMLMAAAVGIAVEAIREIRTPHHTPAAYTLVVLVGVVLIKELLARRVAAAAVASGSPAVQADAAHHRSDALTSAAAFVGITLALVGGKGWEPADDWAALFASAIIFVNGVRVAQPALADLMDRAPGDDIMEPVAAAALATADVRAIEKLRIRRAGTGLYVDIHVQADAAMSLDAAHHVSGAVKAAIRAAVPRVAGVLVHMEPYEGDTQIRRRPSKELPTTT